MAVKFIKERKKQKYLIVGLGVIVIVTMIILWYGYSREEESVVPSTVVASPKEIKISFEVLEDSFLKELQPFVEIPSFVGEKGRENPFLPY